jgi:hypothetical protein
MKSLASANASTIFNATWDQLSALEAWVEEDRSIGQAGRDDITMPADTSLCPYPAWPKYKAAATWISRFFTPHSIDMCRRPEIPGTGRSGLAARDVPGCMTFGGRAWRVVGEGEGMAERMSVPHWMLALTS